MSPQQEDDPARVAAQVGAGAVINDQIVIHRLDEGQHCACAAIEAHPAGEQFVARPCGIFHHDGRGWRQLADFIAFVHWTTFDNPSVPVRLVVKRAGRWMGIEVPRSEIDKSGWIADALGGEAAANVTDYDALRKAMHYFGFAVSECRGCRHEA